MKYKVGDMTLLGEIVKVDDFDHILQYKVQLSLDIDKYICLTESEIDAIINLAELLEAQEKAIYWEVEND